MSKTSDIRARIMSMQGDDVRDELIITLDVLEQLESDFETLLTYVSKTTMQSKATPIGEIMERRGLF